MQSLGFSPRTRLLGGVEAAKRTSLPGPLGLGGGAHVGAVGPRQQGEAWRRSDPSLLLQKALGAASFLLHAHTRLGAPAVSVGSYRSGGHEGALTEESTQHRSAARGRTGWGASGRRGREAALGVLGWAQGRGEGEEGETGAAPPTPWARWSNHVRCAANQY